MSLWRRPVVQTTMEERMDWQRWRGRQEAESQALVSRIESFTQTTAASLEAMHKDINRRFDDQEIEVAEIKRQVTYTNGSVRELKEWRASFEGQAAGEQKVEVRLHAEKQYTRGAMIATIAATSTVAAAIAAVLQSTHL